MPEPELLAALKQALNDLETLKTVPTGEGSLVRLKENIRLKIGELERRKATATAGQAQRNKILLSFSVSAISQIPSPIVPAVS